MQQSGRRAALEGNSRRWRPIPSWRESGFEPPSRAQLASHGGAPKRRADARAAPHLGPVPDKDVADRVPDASRRTAARLRVDARAREAWPEKFGY